MYNKIVIVNAYILVFYAYLEDEKKTVSSITVFKFNLNQRQIMHYKFPSDIPITAKTAPIRLANG